MLSIISKENCSDLLELERFQTMYYKTSQDK